MKTTIMDMLPVHLWTPVIAAGALLLGSPSHATMFDFGNVVRGLNYTNTFVLSNQTGAAWAITKIRPLCECVKAARYDTRIPAGSTGAVVLILETAKLHGNVRYITMVQFAGEQTAQFELRASVLDDISVSPTEVDLGTVRMGTKLDPPAITVSSRTGRKLPPPTIGTKPAWLMVESAPADPTAQALCTGWVMRLRCDAPPAGLVDSQLQFSFACTNSGRYAIRLKGRIEPVFAAQPALLSLGRIATNATVEKTVAILPLGGDPVKIAGVRSSSKAISVAAIATNEPGRASITIRVRPEAKGMIDETLTVLMDNPAQKEVPVRILGNAQ